jgi:protein-S-isoprenylcysteine O-methyltransferase Ste14
VTEPRWPVPLGAGLAVPVGALAGLLEVALAGRALADCDVGVNAAANSFGLMLALPFVIAVDAAAFGVVFVLAYRATARAVRPWVAVVAAVVAGLLALALLAWAWRCRRTTRTRAARTTCRRGGRPGSPSRFRDVGILARKLVRAAACAMIPS